MFSNIDQTKLFGQQVVSSNLFSSQPNTEITSTSKGGSFGQLAAIQNQNSQQIKDDILFVIELTPIFLEESFQQNKGHNQYGQTNQNMFSFNNLLMKFGVKIFDQDGKCSTQMNPFIPFSQLQNMKIEIRKKTVIANEDSHQFEKDSKYCIDIDYSTPKDANQDFKQKFLSTSTTFENKHKQQMIQFKPLKMLNKMSHLKTNQLENYSLINLKFKKKQITIHQSYQSNLKSYDYEEQKSGKILVYEDEETSIEDKLSSTNQVKQNKELNPSQADVKVTGQIMDQQKKSVSDTL
ncbi:UNKNOWN [Stylonychia lemnae]|uniref:Uncharacterized protein n=1 Tax=Stylonychia lemnae TaxID=5949 RepID=A0A078ABZ2_STYLE|nr:UNKNOWN [Stylonychia lemnae]|eukprot:CDW79719.1 UNKNOWN [Stylonychia lemnae]